jgi:hypothetical protein
VIDMNEIYLVNFYPKLGSPDTEHFATDKDGLELLVRNKILKHAKDRTIKKVVVSPQMKTIRLTFTSIYYRKKVLSESYQIVKVKRAI